MVDTLKLDSISELINTLKPKSDSNIFKDIFPLISVLFGTLLALGSQLFTSRLSKSKQRKAELLSLYTDCEKFRYLINDTIKNRNYYNVNCASFYRCHEIEDENLFYYKKWEEFFEKELNEYRILSGHVAEYIKCVEPISKIVSGQNHDCSKFNKPKKVG